MWTRSRAGSTRTEVQSEHESHQGRELGLLFGDPVFGRARHFEIMAAAGDAQGAFGRYPGEQHVPPLPVWYWSHNPGCQLSATHAVSFRLK